jgi:hypothetical protein
MVLAKKGSRGYIMSICIGVIVVVSPVVSDDALEASI